MKKITALFLSLILIFSAFAACDSGKDMEPAATPTGNAAGTPMQETPDTPDASVGPSDNPAGSGESVFSRGSLSGDETVYTSDFAGLRFELPEDWAFASDEELAEIMNMGAEIAYEDEAEIVSQLVQLTTIYDMMAASADGTANVILMYENLARHVGGTSLTEQDYADALSEQLSAVEDMPYDVAASTTATLAGEEHTVMNAVIHGYNVFQSYFIRRVDNYMLVIVFTNTNDPASDGLDVLFSEA